MKYFEQALKAQQYVAIIEQYIQPPEFFGNIQYAQSMMLSRIELLIPGKNTTTIT